MKKDYWPKFWISHGKLAADADEHFQVLRTKNKKSIDEECWNKTLDYILGQLELKESDDVLDLCCGNGLITRDISKQCRSVTCVDVVPELVDKINTNQYPNITALVGDIRQLNLERNSFDKILIYAAIQYLNPAETVEWFDQMYKALRVGGMLFIGDIPDRAKLWNFFDSKEREEVYFKSMKEREAIVGTWFEQNWLLKLSQHAGFKSARIVLQPDYMIYCKYRYDMRVLK
jgi:cyclopropane fatty-acyl-phospholipid synthase-like methyltransferase